MFLLYFVTIRFCHIKGFTWISKQRGRAVRFILVRRLRFLLLHRFAQSFLAKPLRPLKELFGFGTRTKFTTTPLSKTKIPNCQRTSEKAQKTSLESNQGLLHRKEISKAPTFSVCSSSDICTSGATTGCCGPPLWRRDWPPLLRERNRTPRSP